MKYLAVASFAALAAASPALDARDGWEKADPNTWAPVVKPTTTWAPVVVTTKKVYPDTWAPYGKDTAVWDEWNKKPVYTTTVVTAITTYCPEPTTMVHAGKTYTITKATTLTITDCPCTISVPVYVKTSTICDNSPAPTWAGYPNVPVKGASTWADVPVKGASTWADVPVKGASTWADVPVKGASTWADVPAKTPVADASTWANYPASTSTGWNPVATWKGAADKVNVGAGLAGVVGIAALLL